jgi:hypothetical protein
MDTMKKGILSDIIKEMSAIEAGDWKGKKKNAQMTVTIVKPAEGEESAESDAAEEICPDCGESPCACEK